MQDGLSGYWQGLVAENYDGSVWGSFPHAMAMARRIYETYPNTLVTIRPYKYSVLTSAEQVRAWVLSISH